MSSFVIGLDISRNHITAALIRIKSSSNRKLTIVRDTFHIRSFPENIKRNPRSLISGWIDCIDDLLDDYNEEDTIIGIACGISSAMDYGRGICHTQSSESNKDDRFFGLNLHLLFQSAFRDLILRRQQHHYSKYYTPPTSPRTSLFCSKQQINPETLEQTTRVKIRSPTFHTTFNFPIVSTMDKELQNLKLSRQKMRDYCGLQDSDNDETVSYRQTCIHTTEITSPKLPVLTDNNSFKIQTMIDRLSDIPISFFNDTICFAVGEANNIRHRNHERILVLTLGTNFRCAFVDRGKIITNRQDISLDQNSIADDCFSTRGLIDIYKELLQGRTNISNGYSLTLRAFNGDQNAIDTYQIFARRLGQFLIPSIEKFHPNLLLIGGGIAQAWYLMENELRLTLEKFSLMEIYFSLFNEKSICLGAVQQQLSILFTPKTTLLRQTDQYLLPVIKTSNPNPYDFRPSHDIPIGYIGIGHQQLNEKMFRLIRENSVLLIDGFIGTYFDEFADKLNEYYFQQKQKTDLPSLIFYDTTIFLRTENTSKQKSKFSSIFDQLKTDFDLKKDLIDLDKLNSLKNNLSYPCVIIGPGASFVNETSPLIYIDLPKNELYYRIPTQTSFSPLKSHKDNSISMIHEDKNFYYFDYPIFNKLKQELLPRMKFFVDGQRPNCPTWLDGDTFRQALAHISNQPIRRRPCHRTICPNPSKVPVNDTELSETMTTEDGIILSDANHHLVEVSWDIFYASQASRILGNNTHQRLLNGSNDFPIYFQLFDMMKEGNLQNIRTDFRVQNRAYYIIETHQHRIEDVKTSSSYISFDFYGTPNSDELHQNLISADKENTRLITEKYSQSIPSNSHDLFFVPTETIHATGRNQLILEISTRFNSDDYSQDFLHAKQFRCQPRSIKLEQDKYEEQQLPTPDFYIYDIQRLIIEANKSVQTIRSTENRFHLCILVQGDAIEIEFNSIDNNQEKQIRDYNYLETFLIPASIHEYRLRSKKKSDQLILLIVSLKWN